MASPNCTKTVAIVLNRLSQNYFYGWKAVKDGILVSLSLLKVASIALIPPKPLLKLWMLHYIGH